MEIADELSKSIAISVVSSFSELSAELVGRSYGGGVLKLEPSEVSKLLIAVPKDGFPNVNCHFDKMNQLLIDGDVQEAVSLADKITLSQYLGLEERDIKCLREQCSILRERRIGWKRKTKTKTSS